MMNILALGSLERVSRNIHSYYQFRLNRIHKFKAKICVDFEVGNFHVKTVTDIAELKEALILRYHVFHHEMQQKRSTVGIDVDEFDFECDHLIVRDKRLDKIIGTYRLNCSTFTNKFYTANEFMLEKLLATPGVKLELGRACIQKEHRRGVLISLLWRGVAEYMAASNADILFGCSTVMTEDPRDAALLTKYLLEKNRVQPQFSTRPTLPYMLPMFQYFLSEISAPLSAAQVLEAEELLPPLFRGYIKMGAAIGGEPAWDRAFGCIDFLTVLRREDLNRSLWRKYSTDSKEAGPQ